MNRENVRISDAGYNVLSNRELAEKLANAIIKGQDKLRSGDQVKVDDTNLSVKLVTSLSDKELATKKK